MVELALKKIRAQRAMSYTQAAITRFLDTAHVITFYDASKTRARGKPSQ
jgi:hypothetical protein